MFNSNNLCFNVFRLSAPPAPSCRISENISPLPDSTKLNATACLIRINNSVLMVRHRLSGKLDLPAGGVQGN
ncbi:MAG TPA: hypothetical protein DCW59_17300 [Alteromonas sp.]|nr:hypothetical protein [Alteromonas sp.]HCB08281.1 hypothetical protein [Alteromonas sp.]HCB17724.1 hypothetical protein [Alteromonas sp.]